MNTLVYFSVFEKVSKSAFVRFKTLVHRSVFHMFVNLKYFMFIFVSPERDYVITDSVRSMWYVCMTWLEI